MSFDMYNLNFIGHLTDIFIKCMFLTGKMAFDRHDTRQIFALVIVMLVKIGVQYYLPTNIT